MKYAAIIILLAVSAASADTTALNANPPSDARQSPNQAMADLAKQVLLESMPPVYEKRDNWGHQTDMVDGFHWEFRDGRWHFVHQSKKVNDGLWRMYKVQLVNPERNLQVRFTAPRPADDGRTAFSAFLSARLEIEARQEQWRLGIKGLNFHVEGEAKIETKLDIVIGVEPLPGGGFGAVQIRPEVTHVDLRLTELTLKKVDLIEGDLARELGHALEDIVAGEIRKREPEVARKINAQIQKQQSKLVFSPKQFAEVGWEKFQSLLGNVESAVKTTTDGTAAKVDSSIKPTIPAQ
jgi:hypothetical protein